MAYTAGTLEVNIIHQANDILNVFSTLNKELLTTKKLLASITKSTGKVGVIGGKTKGKNTTDPFSKLFNLGKITATVYMARRLANIGAKIVQNGVDYTETLNLWSVAMRENVGLAGQFVEKINKAYGVSEQTIMNTQSVFKNMIGSLGQITDDVAYRLSESITLLALDFASLYNVGVEQAFEKFQAMLAGQVRPIRSAGLDITETTLYQYYQQIGGTKTMRQLNRTEKQLLSILAVYKQMGTAGALGDMSKTLGNFANQSRMLSENFKRIATWSGLIVEHLLTDNEVIIKINAHLIVMGEVLKAIASGMGATEDDTALTPIFEMAEQTNDELDKIQGKLLGFDKFRALNTSTSEATDVDSKLLEALSGYSSVIDMANNKAQELASAWIQASGGIENLVDEVKDLGIAFIALLSLPIASKFSKVVDVFSKGGKLVSTMNLFSTLLISGVVWSVLKAIEAFEKMDYWSGILYIAIGITLVTSFVLLRVAMSKISQDKIGLIGFFKKLLASLQATNKTIYGTVATFGILTIGMAMLIGGVSMFIANFDKLSNSAKVWIPVISALAGAVTALAVGFTLLKGNWVGAIGIGALVAGAGLMVGTKLAIPNYENGASNIDSGTVFRAGEFGKTEAVYTGSNGKTNVANIQQIKSAFYQALEEYGNNHKGSNEPIIVKIGEDELVRATRKGAKKQGLDFVKV